MWTYNVTRDLLMASGRRVVPKSVPKLPDEMMRCARKTTLSSDLETVAVLKIHQILKSPFPNSRFIITRRDLRDAMVSWMRFAHQDFARALGAAEEAIKLTDRYSSFPNAMLIEYSDIVSRPKFIADQITGHLSIEIEQAEIDVIVDRFDRVNVRKRIKNSEDRIRQSHEAGEDILAEIVVREDGTARAYDTATGFQSDHVSDYRDGDWRKMWAADQRRSVHERLGLWLAENGYPVDELSS
jgi:hypothetical protein